MKKKLLYIALPILLGVVSIVSIASTTHNAELEKELKATQDSLAILKDSLAITKGNLTNTEQSIDELMFNESLDEWEIFTLALMKVESNYNISAKSSAGACGYFQFMPVYVDEVNRIHKTNYKFNEVIKSFEQSYEVFLMMQKAHNKDFNIDKALTIHNGKNKTYHRKVYNEMDRIKKYEDMRQKVKNARKLDI